MKLALLIMLFLFSWCSIVAISLMNDDHRLYEIITEWNTDNITPVYHEQEHTYFYYHADHSAALDSTVTLSYDISNQVFYPQSRRIYHYSGDGTLNQMEFFIKNYSSVVTWYESYDYSYDTQQNLSGIIGYYVMDSSSAPCLRLTATYYYTNVSDQLQLSQAVYHKYEPPQGIRKINLYYQNTPNGQRLRDSYVYESGDSLNWEPYTAKSFHYMPTDTSNSETYIDYHKQIAMLQFNNQYNDNWSFAFDDPALLFMSFGELDRVQFYYPQTIGGDLYWQDGVTYDYLYDGQGRVLSTQFVGNPGSFIYEWNQDGTLYRITRMHPNGMAVERYTYIWGAGSPNNDENYAHPPQLILSVYPNPFQNSMTLSLTGSAASNQLSSFEMYNLKGQKVYQYKGQTGKELRWSPTDSNGCKPVQGIYLIKAYDTKGKQYFAKGVCLE